jgi:hypothetical protein
MYSFCIQQECKMEKCTICYAEVHEIKFKGNGVLDAGNFILLYIGNESNTFGTGFMIYRKHEQEV